MGETADSRLSRDARGELPWSARRHARRVSGEAAGRKVRHERARVGGRVASAVGGRRPPDTGGECGRRLRGWASPAAAGPIVAAAISRFCFRSRASRISGPIRLFWGCKRARLHRRPARPAPSLRRLAARPSCLAHRELRVALRLALHPVRQRCSGLPTWASLRPAAPCSCTRGGSAPVLACTRGGSAPWSLLRTRGGSAPVLALRPWGSAPGWLALRPWGSGAGPCSAPVGGARLVLALRPWGERAGVACSAPVGERAPVLARPFAPHPAGVARAQGAVDAALAVGVASVGAEQGQRA